MTQHTHDRLNATLKNNTHWEKISIRDKIFHIKRVKNINNLLDAVSDEEFNQDERLPYWAEIWPSAIALSEYILDNRNDFSDKKILEIGCGLGLVGIAATAVGGDVLFTDYDDYALEYTQINYKRNFKRDAAVKMMDWREAHAEGSYDIILGADILYEKRWLAPVLNVIGKKLNPRGTAIIAEPNRTVAGEFFAMIKSGAFEKQSWLKQTRVCNKLHSVTIHRISKC